MGGAAHADVLDAVGDEVLAGGVGLDVHVVIAHQAVGEGGADGADEEGILGVGLGVTAPAGVSLGLHDGGPEGQTQVAGVGDGARLIGDGGGHFLDDGGVPGRAHGNADGIGGRSGGADAVQGLVPDGESGQVEPGDGGHGVAHLAGLFVQGQIGDQVDRALLHGVVAALIPPDRGGLLFVVRGGGRGDEQARQQRHDKKQGQTAEQSQNSSFHILVSSTPLC